VAAHHEQWPAAGGVRARPQDGVGDVLDAELGVGDLGVGDLEESLKTLWFHEEGAFT
jgi:hypothetical protein